MRSNCNLWAWSQFAKGLTDTMTLRKTKYSRWAVLAESVAWQRTLYPLGLVLGYVAWGLVQVAWFAMYGTWAHVTTGTHEFRPRGDKVVRWLPPFIYDGEVHELEN